MNLIEDSLDVYLGIFILVLFLSLLLPVFITLGKGIKNLKVREDKSSPIVEEELMPEEPSFSLAEIDLIILTANAYQPTATCLVTPDEYAFVLAADYLANQNLFLENREIHSKQEGTWEDEYYLKKYKLKLGLRSAGEKPYAFLFE